MESADLFKCLGDPTRLRILHLLALRGPEMCVCNIVETLGLSQSTVSRQLMYLRHLGLVEDRREGTWMHYSLARPSTKVHAAIIRCISNCLADEKALAADLARFDRGKAGKTKPCPPKQPARTPACATAPRRKNAR